MRISIVHSFYSSLQPSGENVVVQAQADALTRAGHEVEMVTKESDDLQRTGRDKVRAAWTVAMGSGGEPAAPLASFRPDVVHVHNLFPNFGFQWLVPWLSRSVVTIHNFRPLCANGVLFRDGKVCRDCRNSAISGLNHACYRGSRAATLPLTIAQLSGRSTRVFGARRTIFLSDRARAEYSAWGVTPPDNVIVPNFVNDVPLSLRSHTQGWIYVGRLSQEKGVERLLENWPQGIKLTLFGDGPLRRQLESRFSSRNVIFRGSVERTSLRDEMAKYSGLIFSSLWPEGAVPQVVVEALASALPIIAVSGSGGADEVASARCGVVLPREYSNSDLLRAIDEVLTRPKLREVARKRYEVEYSESVWVDRIESVYDSVVNSAFS